MTDPIQQQLVAARRRQILDAATVVFADKGFHRATVREIAREAGIADGTLYNYFENKEALLLALLDRLNETEQRPTHFAEGLAQGSVRDFFVAYLRHRLALLWPHAPLFRALLPQLLVQPALRARYLDQVIAPSLAAGEQFFTTLAAEGKLRSVEVPLAVRALAATLLGLFTLYLLGDPLLDEQVEQLPETLATLFFDGLLPDNARG